MNGISEHKILSMQVENLKNLKKLDINFLGHNVTAILGPNGNGKSTILHALASAFSPLDNGKGENYKFSDFFCQILMQLGTNLVYQLLIHTKMKVCFIL